MVPVYRGVGLRKHQFPRGGRWLSVDGIALLRGRSRGGRGWRDGAVFGAQIGDELGDFLVGEGVAEGRHLCATVRDLAGDLFRRPQLVLADVDEGWRFERAYAASAMTKCAAFVAKEDGAGFFIVGVGCGLGGVCGRAEDERENQRCESLLSGDCHASIFSCCANGLGQPIVGTRRRGGDARALTDSLLNMAKSGLYASQLRNELMARNRAYARGRLHVESFGSSPVIVYVPEGERHGNFFDPAYAAITERAEWFRRFDKIHAQGRRSLPKAERRWRELDSSMSSDALLMNCFCTPGVVETPALALALGIERGSQPEFGWKARVPLKNGRFDRTEVDMRLGSLLVEAKLTESDFQNCDDALAEGYRDFDEVFDRERLPRVEVMASRPKQQTEFPEDYSQEYEEVSIDPLFQAPERPLVMETKSAYASYQLIRNVLAAHAAGASFCVLLDERRPDLLKAWFEVMAAVRQAEMRVRLKTLTWQELSAFAPDALKSFLDVKYGIVPPGCMASVFGESVGFEN